MLILLKGRIFKYAVEMASCDTIYVSGFIKIGSGVQLLREGGYTYRHTHIQQGDLISLLLLFQKKEVA
jgi:hypothetical protein